MIKENKMDTIIEKYNDLREAIETASNINPDIKTEMFDALFDFDNLIDEFSNNQDEDDSYEEEDDF